MHVPPVCLARSCKSLVEPAGLSLLAGSSSEVFSFRDFSCRLIFVVRNSNACMKLHIETYLLWFQFYFGLKIFKPV